MGFKATTNPDFYGVTVKLLRDVVEIITQPLSSLVNHCLIEDRFPDVLKVSRVVPVNKEGDRSMVSSCRTIAIISAVVIKVLETV